MIRLGWLFIGILGDSTHRVPTLDNFFSFSFNIISDVQESYKGRIENSQVYFILSSPILLIAFSPFYLCVCHHACLHRDTLSHMYFLSSLKMETACPFTSKWTGAYFLKTKILF